jgi:hypothetical protein
MKKAVSQSCGVAKIIVFWNVKPFSFGKSVSMYTRFLRNTGTYLPNYMTSHPLIFTTVKISNLIYCGVVVWVFTMAES